MVVSFKEGFKPAGELKWRVHVRTRCRGAMASDTPGTQARQASADCGRARRLPPCGSRRSPAVMNHDDPSHRSPPRAEPLQPDRPDRGTKKQSEDSGSPQRDEPQQDPNVGADKLKKQSEDALENVREGYQR
jgi:hypothetical protein